MRDVARALGYPYGLGDHIAKEIPMGSQGFPMTLDRALTENPELGKLYKAEADVRNIIDLGKKIEGCVRHVGVHAAGVVIAPKPLVNSPLIYIDGVWQIQTPHPFEIPLPPTPKKGYRETLIDSQWVFVRK